MKAWPWMTQVRIHRALLPCSHEVHAGDMCHARPHRDDCWTWAPHLVDVGVHGAVGVGVVAVVADYEVVHTGVETRPGCWHGPKQREEGQGVGQRARTWCSWLHTSRQRVPQGPTIVANRLQQCHCTHHTPMREHHSVLRPLRSRAQRSPWGRLPKQAGGALGASWSAPCRAHTRKHTRDVETQRGLLAGAPSLAAQCMRVA